MYVHIEKKSTWASKKRTVLHIFIVEIKGPESWWIAKSITISRVENQSKVNPQRPKRVVD